MKRFKKNILTMAVALLLAIGAYVSLFRQKAQTNIPDISLRSGAAGPSAEFLNAQKAVAHYRDQIQKHPDVAKNYIELAQLFLQEGRTTGNNREYIPKAQSLLDRVLRREPESAEAIITKASIAATLHQFREARDLAQRAIGLNPHSAFSYGVLCDAIVELG